MTRSNNELWTQVLGELRLAMTTATFDTWVADTDLLNYENGRMLVGVANSYALDWLQHRLIDVVTRTATAQAGRRVELEFTLKRPAATAAATFNGDRPHPTNPTTPETAEEEPPFVGFQPYRSDFTQVPKQFFEVVMRQEVPSVQSVVLAVIDQTVGVITNFNTGERREWWEASLPEIGRAAGIKSLTTVGRAMKRSRSAGYIVRASGQSNYKYRHRRLGEPIDNAK
jgi:chromosomal replication initiation ATPase DnaA